MNVIRCLDYLLNWDRLFVDIFLVSTNINRVVLCQHLFPASFFWCKSLTIWLDLKTNAYSLKCHNCVTIPPVWSWSSGRDCATIKIQTELQQCAHSSFWHLVLNRTWCMDHSITVPILEGSKNASVSSFQLGFPWKLHLLSWLYRMTLWWSWMDDLQVPHTCLCISRTLGLPWNCGSR